MKSSLIILLLCLSYCLVQAQEKVKGIFVRTFYKQDMVNYLENHKVNFDGFSENDYFLQNALSFDFKYFFDHCSYARAPFGEEWSIFKNKNIEYIEQYLLDKYLYKVFYVEGEATKEEIRLPDCQFNENISHESDIVKDRKIDSVYRFNKLDVITLLEVKMPWSNILLEDYEDHSFRDIKIQRVKGEEYIINDIVYGVIGDSLVEVRKDLKNREVVQIPSFINVENKSYKVLSVGDTAFFKGNVKEVVLPDCIERVGDFAFSGSKLNKINFPEKMRSIGIYAFASTLLEEVKLPPTLAKLGAYAFANTKIRGVEIPISLKKIEEGSFMKCQNLQSSKIRLNNVKSIGNAAFAKTGIRDLSFLTVHIDTLGYGCFMECQKLKNVILYEHVTTLKQTCEGEGLFKNCYYLKRADIRSSKVSFCSMFAGCINLRHFSIPDSITNLNGTFRQCSSLKRVYLPRKVKEMYGTFMGCKNLKYVKMPMEIGKAGKLFKYCPNLKTVEICGDMVEDVELNDFEFEKIKLKIVITP